MQALLKASEVMAQAQAGLLIIHGGTERTYDAVSTVRVLIIHARTINYGRRWFSLARSETYTRGSVYGRSPHSAPLHDKYH